MRIGEALEQAGVIDTEKLKLALEEQEKNHDHRLGEVMIRLGLVTPERLVQILAELFRLPYIRLRDIYKDIKPEALDAVPLELARRYNVLPVEVRDRVLVIAMFDPLNLHAIDTIRIKSGYKVECVLAVDSEIQEAIEYCYQNSPRMARKMEEFFDLEVQKDGDEENREPEKLLFDANDQPVVQYVKSLIVQAVHSGASDVLLQPKEKVVQLRFRIDGVLYEQTPPPKSMLAAIDTRVKILSGLDISQRRLPQDGRFKVQMCNSDIDVRTSFFPTIYGESMVLRLLNTSQNLRGVDHLGFDPGDLDKFRKLINHSYGIILVTGPTGSGKTTTLYTALNEIKSSAKNIITLEDPVEYRLPFIQQSQVNPQIGFDFASGLRSILRQNPDIIMIGEIRDRETAEIAIHAALTGHLVFATLHTNDASCAAVRLSNMGVEPFLITSSLLGVVAQRLIRTICPECREAYKPGGDVLAELGLADNGQDFYRGQGCPHCLQSGYKGRQGVYELLVPDENIRRLILGCHSGEEIRAAAAKRGMKTLRQLAFEKLLAGLTTPEEVLRVTQETEES